MILHSFELFSQLDSLVEVLFFLFFSTFVLDLVSPFLDRFLKLGEAMLVCIQLHVLLRFHKGCDQLTASLTHKI